MISLALLLILVPMAAMEMYAVILGIVCIASLLETLHQTQSDRHTPWLLLLLVSLAKHGLIALIAILTCGDIQ
jgi:hypothetical protein